METVLVCVAEPTWRLVPRRFQRVDGFAQLRDRLASTCGPRGQDRGSGTRSRSPSRPAAASSAPSRTSRRAPSERRPRDDEDLRHLTQHVVGDAARPAGAALRAAGQRVADTAPGCSSISPCALEPVVARLLRGGDVPVFIGSTSTAATLQVGDGEHAAQVVAMSLRQRHDRAGARQDRQDVEAMIVSPVPRPTTSNDETLTPTVSPGWLDDRTTSECP